MSNTIMITKRDGTQEPLDLEKMHKVTYEAEKGLAGVSASQIEMNANLQFYDGMTTEEIQEILKLTTITLNLDPIFQIMIILKENHLEEIIIMRQN